MGELAEANSLLGQLQRGRGAGFRRAVRAEPRAIHPLLVACVTQDPRWDRQIEPRGDYYASLILHTALPLDLLDAHLRVLAEVDPHNPNDLVLGTLRALAERRYTPAVAIMRAYLIYGEYWGTALEVLIDGRDNAIAVDEVGRIIDRRFPEDEVLDEELPSPWWNTHTRPEPWRSLGRVNPRVDRILGAHEAEEQHRQQRQDHARATFAALSARQLLVADIDHAHARLAALALQERASTDDLNPLLDTAQRGEFWQRFVAFRGLERLADPAAFPILHAFFEAPGEQPVALYGAAVRAIAALPAAVTLDLARAWFDAADGVHRHVALRILKAHATVADVSRVRAALLPSLCRDTPDTNECYMQCDMLEILARFPTCGPYPEATTVFEEAGYSRTRVYAAAVLAGSDRSHFAGGVAVDCLWDCEERVRQIGCERVDVGQPDASGRLHALARDPFEDEDVRAAAKERLASANASDVQE